MVNPTRGWDRVPIFGWWSDNPGVPAKGYIELTMAQRVRRADGRMIYPGGARLKLKIGDQENHDEDVRAQVKAAMRAVAIVEHGESWDETAWEARWDKNLAAAIFTSYWAADDPDITPHGTGDDGYTVSVREALESGAGKPYNIQPLISDLARPIPGINLADIEVPPGTPSVPAPIYAKGQRGGIAALDVVTGNVLDADGNEITAGDGLDPAELDTQTAANITNTSSVTADALGGSVARYGGKRSRVAQPTIIRGEYMQAGHSWVASGSDLASSDLNDTGTFSLGTQSATVTVAGNGGSANLQTLGLPPLDLTGRSLRIRMKVSDYAGVSYLQVHVGDSALTTGYVWRIPAGPNEETASGRWRTITLPWSAVFDTRGADTIQPNGLPSRSDGFTDVRLTLMGNDSGPVSMSVQSFEVVAPPGNPLPTGALTITFDDNWLSLYDLARPAMDVRGVRGTSYTIVSHLGGADKMTAAQTHALYKHSGWEIGGHAYERHRDYTTWSAAEVDDDFRRLRDWLLSQGFDADSSAYPHGGYGWTTDGVWAADIAARYFQTSRSINGGLPALPPAEPHQLDSYTGVSRMRGTSHGAHPDVITAAGGILDKIHGNGEWAILTFHRITEGAATTSEECSIADFEAILDAALARDIEILPVNDVMRRFDLIENPPVAGGFDLTVYPDEAAVLAALTADEVEIGDIVGIEAP